MVVYAIARNPLAKAFGSKRWVHVSGSANLYRVYDSKDNRVAMYCLGPIKVVNWKYHEVLYKDK